jgi:positive regulator of sigma E activity
MSSRNLWVLLLNTLLFPLGGFTAGAILVQWMYADDMLAFVGSMLGLGVGLLACRKQSFDRVVIEEVSSNE